MFLHKVNFVPNSRTSQNQNAIIHTLRAKKFEIWHDLRDKMQRSINIKFNSTKKVL